MPIQIISDEYALRYINQRFESEGVKIERVYSSVGDGVSQVTSVTRKSKEGNYILLKVHVWQLGMNELRHGISQLRQETYTGLFLPYQSGINISVVKDLVARTREEVDVPIELLNIATRQGRVYSFTDVTEVLHGRSKSRVYKLKSGESLEWALDVAFEAYRTRFKFLPR